MPPIDIFAMQPYTTIKGSPVPRLPLEGDLDLTYRCNCNCRHCWVRLPENHRAAQREVSFEQIVRMADEARAMGCRRWSISGGEPMLRPDFTEIFNCLTRNSLPYLLNTNGTLITPAIARLLKRKGAKMIALYGATAATHDHITRTPGSFAAVMQGFAYLREAKTGFTVQIIVLRDNHHELDAMVRLALSLSPSYRLGAPWLYLSAARNAARNREIACQRLGPVDAIPLDPPDTLDDGEDRRPAPAAAPPEGGHPSGRNDRLFAACIDGGRDFHIDPYGGMTFCPFIKDPALRYSLPQGSFEEAWERFIPSLADKIRGEQEYREGCGRCAKREDCRWCPAYGWLEQGRYSAKVPYLCQLADETRSYRENWRRRHRRYFGIAGITVRVDSDLPFTETTLAPKFKPFEVDGPGPEMISLRHHFSLAGLNLSALGQEVYRRVPWAIYRRKGSWIYLGIAARRSDKSLHAAAEFNADHTRGRIYHPDGENFLQGNLHALTLFSSDQIILAPALADREACFFHAAGLEIDGKGFLLVGHSGAGKTTAATLLKSRGTVLCDDRIIVRRWPDGLRIHGTWSHGDLADVSAASAPLTAVLFLDQARANRLVAIPKGIETARLLSLYVVKSLATADWWEKTLSLIENIAGEVPAYRLEFDKSGRIAEAIGKLL